MKEIFYEAGESSPGVALKRKSGTFKISGTSFPEDVVAFYEPICGWFDEYIERPLKKTILDFQMSYFNTASAKYLLTIMERMEKLSEAGHKAKIRWFFTEGDIDLMEAGEEFADIVEVDFELVPMKENETVSSDHVIDDLIDNIN
jgi:hypothetical protein